jgi:hypothetical protein
LLITAAFSQQTAPVEEQNELELLRVTSWEANAENDRKNNCTLVVFVSYDPKEHSGALKRHSTLSCKGDAPKMCKKLAQYR